MPSRRHAAAAPLPRRRGTAVALPLQRGRARQDEVSPLTLACELGLPNCVALLLLGGAEPTADDKAWAIEYGFLDQAVLAAQARCLLTRLLPARPAGPPDTHTTEPAGTSACG